MDKETGAEEISDFTHHTASRRQSWNCHPGSLSPKPSSSSCPGYVDVINQCIQTVYLFTSCSATWLSLFCPQSHNLTESGMPVYSHVLSYRHYIYVFGNCLFKEFYTSRTSALNFLLTKKTESI